MLRAQERKGRLGPRSVTVSAGDVRQTAIWQQALLWQVQSGGQAAVCLPKVVTRRKTRNRKGRKSMRLADRASTSQPVYL
jgi:hypothetical protein